MRNFILGLSLGLFFFAGGAEAQAPCSIELIAGGGSVITGAGGPATEAEILDPADARVGPDGLLYIADRAQDVIWRVLSDGTIELFAGTGEEGSSGNGGPATQALLDGPESLAFGPDGSLYVYLSEEFRIRRIAPDGVIHAFAGSGVALGSPNLYEPGMTAAEMPLGVGTKLAVSPDSGVYAVLPSQSRVVRIDADGTVTPIAGGGAGGSERGFSGDGGPAVDALLDGPSDVAVDGSGKVFIADRYNDRIRVVGTDGVIDTHAVAEPPFYFLQGVREIEVDAAGLVYWIGQGFVGRVMGDGSQETYLQADSLFVPFSLGPSGEIYFFSLRQVFRIAPGDPSATHIAGIGSVGGFGEGGSALDARLSSPEGLAAGGSGEVYFVDLDRVRVVEPTGDLQRFAGTGERGFAGDGGPAAQALLQRPRDVAVGTDGTVYIADWGNSRIRAVASGGVINSYAGNGNPSCQHDFFTNQCGDGGPAIDATVPLPERIEAAPDGSLYVLDSNSFRDAREWLRRIAADGTIETAPFVSLDGSGNLAEAEEIAVRPDGRLVVSARNGLDRSAYLDWDPDGTTGVMQNLTDYLPLRSFSMAYGPDGSLYAADGLLLRRVSPTGDVRVLVSSDEYSTLPDAPLVISGNRSIIDDVTAGPGGDVYLVAGSRLYRMHQPTACALPPVPEIANVGIVHGATYEGPPRYFVSKSVAPGQILSIFGRRLGPAQLVGGQVVNGQVTTELAGVRVLIDGQPIPLLYVSAGQIGAITPFGTSTDGARPLQVEVDGVLSEAREIQITDADPGLFTLDSSGSGPAAAINQDGSLNSAANPARPGEIVALWGTGFGQTNPPGVDGRIVADSLPQPLLPVTATIGGIEAQVLYAGAAPGMVEGVTQVNLLIPGGLTKSGAVEVSLGVGPMEYSQSDVTVFVQP